MGAVLTIKMEGRATRPRTRSLPNFEYLILLISFFISSGDLQAQDVGWLSDVDTAEAFETVSVEDSGRADVVRVTKFLAPARTDTSLLDTVYQNVNLYPLHLEFMVTEFPDRFGGLSNSDYLDLIYYRETRDYFAGAILEFRDPQGKTLYGFSFYTEPGERPQQEDVRALHERLSATFSLRPFAYAPLEPQDIEEARAWSAPDFPVYLPEGLTVPEYEVYSQAVNYGRIRLFTLSAFLEAVDAGQVGWQDFVVIDTAPTDIETVVAGVATGSRQGELSHVNVRSIRRGTPNAFLDDALEVLAPYEGQLVRVEFGPNAYEITGPVELQEAEDWWAEHRPLLPPLPQPDDDFAELVTLPELAAETQDSLFLTARHGGKATGMGLLYSILDSETLVEGFSIPFSYYVDFMRSNTTVHPTDATQTVTYEEYIRLLLDLPQFRGDSQYRRERLDAFRDIMRDEGNVDPRLIGQLANRITDVFGSTMVKVRFRSSSNTEDNLAFNGAGLYDSTSVCVEDSFDNDTEGPSHCDPELDNERSIERGLKKVWASLWNPRAYEERDYYQIEQQQTRMGILVSRAFPHEDSNGVAFTGDPVAGHKGHFVINVQLGDESVVQPGTGVIPEKVLIQVSDAGVQDIRRMRSSSLLPEGEWILSDAQLQELGAVLFQIDRDLPVELGEYSRQQVYMDVEFKFDKGELVVKQVRPTLLSDEPVAPAGSTVILRIPEDTHVVGVFQEDRMVNLVYEFLSRIDFLSGDFGIPLAPGQYPLDIVDRFQYSPERLDIAPLSDGQVTVTRTVGNPDRVLATFQQTFDVDGYEFVLRWTLPTIEVQEDVPSPAVVLLEEPYLSREFFMQGRMQVGVRFDTIQFASETYEGLPLYILDLQLEDGQTIRLHQRWQMELAGTGPSNLVYAEVDILEGTVQQSDYWKLVYAAEHHNQGEVYWVLFEPPLGEAYGIAIVDGDSFYEGDERVYTLDEDFYPLRYLNVESVEKRFVEVEPTPIPTPTPTEPVPVDNWIQM